MYQGTDLTVINDRIFLGADLLLTIFSSNLNVLEKQVQEALGAPKALANFHWRSLANRLSSAWEDETRESHGRRLLTQPWTWKRHHLGCTKVAVTTKFCAPYNIFSLY